MILDETSHRMTGTDLGSSIDSATAATLLAEVDADPTIAAMTSAARRLRPRIPR